MRKLPQEFAFPLGLGSKKHHQTNYSDSLNRSQTNNNNVTVLPGSSNGDTSPRAPCQDLDTINL